MGSPGPFFPTQRGLMRFSSLAGLVSLAALSACAAATAAPSTSPSMVPSAGSSTAPSTGGGVAGRSAEPFLDTLQQRTFAFFWETADPQTRLVPDRWPTPSFSSVAAVGFGLTGLPIGAERGYVTRPQAAARALQTLRWLWRAPQGPAAAGMTGYRGFYYHFLDMRTGERYRDVELSSVDTSLLLGGVLVCREYFDRGDSTEAGVRALADSIYRRVDWTFMLARPPLISMGWTPEHGLHGYDWRGYDEAMLVYVLALGSPTHPVAPEAWTAWTATYQWGGAPGQEHVGFAPLFGHQYSHLWIDFRGIHDAYMRGKGIDYFENSRRATLAQRAYAVANPAGWAGYSGDVWGLTASDGPVDGDFTVGGRQRHFFTYAARGVSFTETRDDGTIAPTAAGGSIPFAPEIAIPALREMRRRYGDHLFGRYGFVDAFNPTLTDSSLRVQTGSIVPGVGSTRGQSWQWPRTTAAS
jgi:hypothetical protein